AFAVVVGTLVIQGLTLKPLLRALDLHDDDPVGRELLGARERALHAGLSTLADDASPAADAIRQEFSAAFKQDRVRTETGEVTRSAHHRIHRRVVTAARHEILTMRANDEIGDDAFHLIEEELDWLEMSSPATRS